jgi:hypothetical protein
MKEVEEQLDASSPAKIHPSREPAARSRPVTTAQVDSAQVGSLLATIQRAVEPDRVQVAVAALKQILQRRPRETLPALLSLDAVDTLVHVVENPQWLPITHRTAAEVTRPSCSVSPNICSPKEH